MGDDVDPLVGQPDGEIHVPPGLTGEEKVERLLEAAMDHVNLHSMAWPAKDKDGRHVRPPDDHILDHLARVNELVDEERLLTTIGANTVAVLTELPTCDFCQTTARYDATVELHGRRGGAYMCSGCYDERGSGTLGASGDVYLMTSAEVPDAVRSRYDHAAAAYEKPPLGGV